MSTAPDRFDLKTMQEDFYGYLTDRTNTLASRMVGGPHADLQTLLAIYHDAYWSRLVEILGNDFPRLKVFMGETGFERLGYDYVARRPSRSWTARNLGAALSEFLRHTQPYMARPELAEMAAFEWALMEAFDAADAQPLPVEVLAGVPPHQWGDMSFALHPTVRRLEFRSNVTEIWAALAPSAFGVAPAAPPPPVAQFGDEVPYMIWRMDLDVKYRRLDTAEADAFDLIGEGLSFGSVCQELCALMDEDDCAIYAARFLHGWMQLGLIVGFDSQAPYST